MWPFKKKEKFMDGGFVRHEKQPDHQDQKQKEPEISEPIKTISKLINDRDSRFTVAYYEDKYHVVSIKSDDVDIKVNRILTSICGPEYFAWSTPEIGITKNEARLLYSVCTKRLNDEKKELESKNRAKLVEIYCAEKGSKGDKK